MDTETALSTLWDQSNEFERKCALVIMCQEVEQLGNRCLGHFHEIKFSTSSTGRKIQKILPFPSSLYSRKSQQGSFKIKPTQSAIFEGIAESLPGEMCVLMLCELSLQIIIFCLASVSVTTNTRLSL